MTLPGHGMTMSDLVARHARVNPAAEALIDARSRRTYRELDGRVNRLAAALTARGVSAGDRVAVLGLNGVEVVEAWLATLRLGAIAVPVNFRLVADEVAYVLRDSGAAAVIAEAAFAPLIRAARATAPSVTSVVTIGGDYEAVLAEAPPDPVERAVPDTAPAFIMYTSGTTGAPKGAVLTHRNLLLHAFSSILTQGDTGPYRVWMSAAPLFHIAGLSGLLPGLIIGGTSIIPPSGGFDPAATVRTLADEGVTSCFMVPAQWQAVCALPGLAEFDLSRLRRLSWGAAPASTSLLRKMIDTFPAADVCSAFGQTECSPVTTLLRGEDSVRKIGSVGTPILNVEARVVDDDMNDVPRGEVGEIVYRGPMIMKEYWNRPAETAEAFRGGWFHSGDLVRQDEDGYFYVVDRKKDMIISGGENIYCAEVENALSAHPKIAEVAVVGVPDPTWGETPLAVIVAADPSDPPTEAEVEDFSRTHLAAYKRPRRMRIVESLPRNPSGKVLKTRLRDEAAT
ncbi:long-chain-fatty-acid--CoA ligase [Actinomadura rugatobispora]|uniref:Long-chain-fatty-acid--CoA ligase n=1 Tax=Actinomadura rugatobispora TaxID=1994 RepID=A0ABW0ZUA7_9ACTN|nr:fatty-acid--CoA ligase FadD5 [Actinomadura rugatobispora]